MTENEWPYSVYPTGYRVLVLPDPIEDVSEGGIVIVADEKAERAGQIFGKVLAIGPIAFKAFQPGTPWCEAGQRIMFSKYAGKTVICKKTKERLMLINDEDVVALVFDEVKDCLDDGEVTLNE